VSLLHIPTAWQVKWSFELRTVLAISCSLVEHIASCSGSDKWISGTDETATDSEKAINKCRNLSRWNFLQQIYSRVLGLLDPKMNTETFETSQLVSSQKVISSQNTWIFGKTVCEDLKSRTNWGTGVSSNRRLFTSVSWNSVSCKFQLRRIKSRVISYRKFLLLFVFMKASKLHCTYWNEWCVVPLLTKVTVYCFIRFGCSSPPNWT
jgi:hypothetical protein